jgi:hypothetical protein
MTWWMARAVATSIEAYLMAGALFALVFLPRGVLAIDDGLRASPVMVRVMLVPGMMLLWPIFLRRWITGRGAPAERNAHRRAAARRTGGRP